MAAVIEAAKEEIHVFPLAALSLFAEKPHQGHHASSCAFRLGTTLSISSTATRMPVWLYDSGTRSRCSGKERDAETGLDYFLRRYLSSAQGRFTTPDPVGIIKQKLFDPQQWNMYSYVRNNPLRLLDPTGEYVANCGDDVKNCDKQIQQFEKTRLQALKSKDENIRNAASAYGALGDKNGVNLTIANVVDPKHTDVLGTVTAQTGTGGLTFNGGTNTFQQATQVTIKSGLSGSTLEGVLVHEGVHVEDRANFVNSISLGGAPEFKLSFNPGLNITGRQSEINAYGVENLFLRSIGQPQRNITDILAHPPYSDNPNIDKPLFIDVGKPQQ